MTVQFWSDPPLSLDRSLWTWADNDILVIILISRQQKYILTTWKLKKIKLKCQKQIHRQLSNKLLMKSNWIVGKLTRYFSFFINHFLEFDLILSHKFNFRWFWDNVRISHEDESGLLRKIKINFHKCQKTKPLHCVLVLIMQSINGPFTMKAF